MCRHATIYSAPAYELQAKMIKSDYGTTLRLITVVPIANHPEPHLAFEVTLPKDDLLFLADFINLNV
jgi:hypothetical protein